MKSTDDTKTWMSQGFLPACLVLLTIVAFGGFSLLKGGAVGAQGPLSSMGNTSQMMPILESSKNPDPAVARGGGDITIVDDEALAADHSPLSVEGGKMTYGSGSIATYVVHEGDTLSEIADMFGVSINTVRWANNMTAKSVISPGQKLLILPITGVRHTVKKGDTLASIAKKYKGDIEEIAQFNGLEEGASLAVGDEVIVPDGEVALPAASKSSGGSRGGGGPTYSGYYLRPIAGGVRTQGLHGYNGVDLASEYGAPIFASAAGEVIVSKTGGWNGGYGNYIVIRHDNGTQTLYAHNSTNIVSVGDVVSQGQTIGYIGSTGRSTGAHVHFEIRGATNPF